MDWLGGAVHVMVSDAAEKLSGPDMLRLGWLDIKGSGEWTPVERLDAHTRCARYIEVLRLAGIRWKPVPTSGTPAERRETVETRKIWAFDGRFLVRFPYGDIEAKAAVAAVPGLRWNGAAYAVKSGVASADAIEAMVREHGFVLDEQGEAEVASVRASASALAVASRAKEGALAIAGLEGELRPYQASGVAYLTLTERSFLADDMGLGKTAQALAAVQALAAWPAVVVTLAAVKLGWKAECERWLPGVKVVMVEGKEPGPGFEPGERTLFIVNYDILAARVDELKGAGAVIFDESHHLKNGKAKRTAAAKALARGVKVRFCLTGTPVLNRPIELLPQLQLLGRLDDLGGFWNFTQRYCAAKQANHGGGRTGWDMSGAAHLDELHDKLRSVCFLRRTKDQVLAELPPQIVTRVPLGMTVEGRRRYDAAAADIKAWLADKACGAEWEKSVAHLGEEEREWQRSVKINEAIERLDGMELLLRMQTLGLVAAEGKRALAAEWITELCASRKVLLFGHHRAVMRDGLLPDLADLGPVMIDGDTPAPARAAAVQRFQRDPACRLLLANLTAGGTGLDGLQHAAADVAFIEWPWTPAGVEQAISRVHRMGQSGTVHVWHLMAEDTVDATRLAVLDAKAGTVGALTDGDRRSAGVAAARKVARGMFNDKLCNPPGSGASPKSETL